MAASYKIATVGIWHLGEIYSAGLAGLGHEVIGVSDDKSVIDGLLKNIPPLPEPQLEELIAKNQSSGRLRYSTDFSEIKKCSVFWITFDTPVDDNDESDLSPIFEAIKKSAPYLQDDVLFVVSSQVPVGTGKKIKKLIKEIRPNLDFHYVYTPENLRLGEAVKCFFEPSRVVVGADNNEGFRRIGDIFSGIRAEILEMSPASAEMAKHALNSFLATSISFINDIADVCEKNGADVLDVIKALKLDPRIGPKAFLDAGLGFSGGTLGRDLKSLIRASQEAQLKLPVIESALQKNNDRPIVIVEKLNSLLGGLNKKIIAIFGLTYKTGTRTLRRSRSLEIAKLLSSRGAMLHFYDPHVLKEEIPNIKNSVIFNDPYKAAEGIDALIFITPWPEFKKLHFGLLSEKTKINAVLFDTSNFLYNEAAVIKDAGFHYLGIGRPTNGS